MQLENYINGYDIQTIKNIEENEDLQYIYLNQAWQDLQDKSDENKAIFLCMIIQNALVSYQLSGTGENRWKEFAQFAKEFLNHDSKDKDLINSWKDFFKTCKNNRRLINMKIGRIEKFEQQRQKICEISTLNKLYDDMKELNLFLAKTLNQDEDAKTIVFAVKMFGYGQRIISGKFIPYPKNITIPLDSRLTKLYESDQSKTGSKKEMTDFYRSLSQKNDIPPLHLDSLLWIRYWKEHIKL